MTPERNTAGTRRVVGIATFVGIALGVGGLMELTRFLERLPNGPETYQSHMPALRGAVMGAALCLAASVGLAHGSRSAPVRRVGRIAGGIGALTVLLWYAPVPFAPQRLLLMVALLFAGALYAIQGLRIAWLSLGRTDRTAWPAWTGPAMVLGMVSASCTAIILMKMNAIGWETAID